MAGTNVIVFFTNSGTPKTGLSPVLDIWDVTNSIQLGGALSMVEVGGGYYKYWFAAYDADLDYGFVADGGDTLSSYDRYKYASNEVGVVSAQIEELNNAATEEIRDAILDETLADHTTVGTVGASLNFAYDFVGGKYKIDTVNNQLILYKEDNVTEIARFDLKDISGNPSSSGVFERTRV